MSTAFVFRPTTSAEFTIDIVPERTRLDQRRSDQQDAGVPKQENQSVAMALQDSKAQMIRSGLIACASVLVGVGFGLLSIQSAAFFLFGSGAAHVVAYCELNRLR